MRRPPLTTPATVLWLTAAILLMAADGLARAGPLVDDGAWVGPLVDGGAWAAPLADGRSRPGPLADGRASPRQSPAAGASPRGGAVRPVPGHVLRPFDPPANPYGPGHRGVDLAAQAGDQVVAALAGTIVFAGEVARVGWVTVDHGGGLVTTYGPLQQRTATGAAVQAGQALGRLGGPGEDPPTHLDWGARLDGDYIDPLSLLQRWHLRLTAANP